MLHTKKYIKNNGISKLKAPRKTLKGGAEFQAKKRPQPRQRGVDRRGLTLGEPSVVKILQSSKTQGVIGNEDNNSSNNNLSRTSSERRRQPARQPVNYNSSNDNSSNNEFDVENLLPDPKTLPQDTKLKQLKVAMTEFARITQDISRKIKDINQRIQ